MHSIIGQAFVLQNSKSSKYSQIENIYYKLKIRFMNANYKAVFILVKIILL